MKKTLAAVAAASFAVTGAHAASIIIDDFDQDISVGLSLLGGAESNSASDAYMSTGGMMFDRVIEISSSNAQGSNIIIASDSLTVNSGNLGDIEGSISWTLSDTSGGIDLTNSATFQADIVSNSVSTSDGEVDMTLTLVSGIGGTEVSETVSFTVAQGDDLLSVKLAQFVSVDLTDIDSIVLAYTSNAFEGSDFTLENAVLFTAVPVPGALPLMLAGIGFYAARRARFK
ncbi:MAG: PEP-CTERM sorting domain-containing protein [Pseudomonadota bacterium]